MNYKNPYRHLDCSLTLRENKRAKRITLRIKSPQEVVLTIPYGSSVKEALLFATEQETWVSEKLLLAKEKKEKNNHLITSSQNFSTKFHQFKFVAHKHPNGYVRILEKETLLYYPQHLQEDDEKVQEIVKLALLETYRNEAKAYLPPRLLYLAQKHNFTFQKVSIRDSKGRWGSCSSQQNISLSLSLMKLPYHLIDYIMLHELCHTIEMNHGPRFYALLNKVSDNQSDELRKELKKYNIR